MPVAGVSVVQPSGGRCCSARWPLWRCRERTECVAHDDDTVWPVILLVVVAAAVRRLPVQAHVTYRFQPLGEPGQGRIAEPAQECLETSRVPRRSVVADP